MRRWVRQGHCWNTPGRQGNALKGDAKKGYGSFQTLRVERATVHVRLDAATRRNLEISETMLGETSPTLLSLLDTCSTNMGSRLLRQWLHHPLRDREMIQKRLDGVSFLIGEGGSGPHLQVREYSETCGRYRAHHRPYRAGICSSAGFVGIAR